MKKLVTLFVTLFLITVVCSAATAAEKPSAQEELSYETIGTSREVTIGGNAEECTCGIVCFEDDVEIATFRINENSDVGKEFLERDVESIRKAYPVGTKIKMIHSEEKSLPSAGTVGTVVRTDSAGMLRVVWEDGSESPLIPEIDAFELIG